MPERKKRLIAKTRFIFIGITAGIVILALESLILKQDIFLNYALGLATAGIAFITLIIYKIVRPKK